MRIIRSCCLILSLLSIEANAQSISFAPPALTPGRSGTFNLTAGDFNKDGKADVAVISVADNTVQIYLSKGDGSLTPGAILPVDRLPYSVTTADLNRDGKLDLVVINNGGSSYSVLLGGGDGTFRAAVTTATTFAFPRQAAIADFNADGIPDMAITSGAASTEIWLGKGDGTFTAGTSYPSGGSPTAIATADMNADGKADLIVLDNVTSGVFVFLGKGTGQFTALPPVVVGTPSGGAEGVLVVAELNGDGRPDVITGTLVSKVLTVALNKGDGTFGMPTSVAFGSGALRSSSIVVADFDGDGRYDIAIADNQLNMVAVVAGKGDGTFQPYSLFALNAGVSQIVAADVDLDGKTDLIATQGAISVLRNTSGTAPSPAPVLSLSASQVAFTAESGSVPPAQTIAVTNGGTGALIWSATSSVPWVVPSPAFDRAPGTLSLAVASGAPTAVGTYTASISILATGSATPRTVPVTLTITAAKPVLSLSVSLLRLTYTPGGPAPPQQAIAITNSRGGSLAWTATTSATWLTLSQTLGTAPSSITAGVNVFLIGTTPGVYQASVMVTAPAAANSPLTLPVTLTVTQPVVQPPLVFSVQSSASYGAAIAQGSIFVVQGTRLGPATLVQAGAYPLSAQLAGSSVQVVAGGTAVNCPMFYTSAGAIAAILPSNTPTGTGALRVTYGGNVSPTATIQVVGSRVGIYTVSSAGSGPGIITGLDFVTKSAEKPAKPGEILVAWVTGLGASPGSDFEVPKVIEQYAGTEVFVGSKPAKLLSATRSGCCAGLDQVAFEVPDTELSCFTPVSIRTPAGTSNFVTLAISANGEPCSNPVPGVPVSALTRPTGSQPLLVGLLAVGQVSVLQGAGFDFSQGFADRLSKMLNVQIPTADVLRLVKAYRIRDMRTARRIAGQYAPQLKTANTAAVRDLLRAAAASAVQQGAGVRFTRSTSSAPVLAEYAAIAPPTGACTVAIGLPRDADTRTRSLDAGLSLTITSPAGTRTMTRISNGQYQALLGDSAGSATAPGRYTITGTGGKDVGPFSASLEVGTPFSWTNKSSTVTLDRSLPTTVTWTGGSVPGHLLIGGTAQSGQTAAIFLCTAETAAGSFTIPQFMLSALPVTTKGNLFISAHPLEKLVSAPGLDLAYFADGTGDSRTVAIR